MYRKHFGAIAAVVVVIWLPLELLQSYMDRFVFDPSDFHMSFKIARLLDNSFGLIVTSGIISIGYTSCLGQPPSFRSGMSVGLRSWGRMWWTRVLVRLSQVVGFLLLIIPGIYLLVRLALAEPVAVCERTSGVTAMRRSFELTEGRFWQIFLLGLVFGAVLVAAVVCASLPAILIPAMDHWLIAAAVSLMGDLVAAFGTLCFFCAYAYLSNERGLAEPDVHSQLPPSRYDESPDGSEP